MAPFRRAQHSRNVLEILKGTLAHMRDEVVLEPCVPCDHEACGVAVILSATASGTKHFDQVKDCLDVICPACHSPFSISIFKLQWMEVDEREFAQGFFRAGDALRFVPGCIPPRPAPQRSPTKHFEIDYRYPERLEGMTGQ